GDGQLTTSADLHARDALLPTGDQAGERELVRLATVPGGVELLAGLEVDTDVVDLDDATGLRLGSLTHDEVLDHQVVWHRSGLGFNLWLFHEVHMLLERS